METPNFIAHRSICTVSQDGSSRMVYLCIGAPYQISQDEWACAVCLSGLHANLPDIRATDSWQALQLAAQFIRKLLGYFVEEGGRLYWPSPEEEISLQELFP
ncbi:DUF6968 family protein [Acidovorax facilis]|uniref:DUF6968 family protein n=1 Tax=Acidovorax facilis TaxID=12917 RepID=UPI003CF88B55